MFVRWQSRGSRNSEHYGDFWSAILVESKRINGKPQQRHVAYLGSITAKHLKVDAHRCYFWDGVVKRLDQLGERVAANREKIEAAITQKVPRPTSDEYKEIARDICKDIGWEWLSGRFKEALKDEPEKWKDHEGDAVKRFRNAAAGVETKTCHLCERTIGGNSFDFLVGAERKPGSACSKCVVEALNLLVEKRSAAEKSARASSVPTTDDSAGKAAECSVVDQSAAPATDCMHHTRADRSGSKNGANVEFVSTTSTASGLAP